MCDTIVVVDDEVLFAKNSDRDPNEAQFPEWHAAADHPPGSALRCTWITIPQVDHTHATLISRPFWMWGAEMGTNEHGVTIGNEAVFTDQPYSGTGLTGMDLLRLALERSTTADEAVQIIVSLMETHGQGGGCGHENRSFTYHNSFLVVDPGGAIVLETAGRLWATERVEHGVRTISNGLTIPGFAENHRDRLRSRVSACDTRTTLTARLAEGGDGINSLFAALRSHGETRWPRYHPANGTLAIPCMHGGGLVASSVSTAGWVGEVSAGRHWVSATSAQCLGLFKPVTVGDPADIGPLPDDHDDRATLWWRHERIARSVMRNPAAFGHVVLEDRDRIERDWIAYPPGGQEAFDTHMGWAEKWSDRVAAVGAGDVRPWWARRYWTRRERLAA